MSNGYEFSTKYQEDSNNTQCTDDDFHFHKYPIHQLFSYKIHIKRTIAITSIIITIGLAITVMRCFPIKTDPVIRNAKAININNGNIHRPTIVDNGMSIRISSIGEIRNIPMANRIAPIFSILSLHKVS